MSLVQIDIPEEILISLKETPETISGEISMLAAVKLYELRKLSFETAAQLAGVSRVEFLNLLDRYQVSPFNLSTQQRQAIAQLKVLFKETQAIHAETPLTEEEVAAEIDAYRQGQ